MGSWKICVLLLLASATQSSAFYRKVGLGWFDNWLPEASSFDDSMESTDGFFTFDSPLVCPQNCTCEDIATVPPTTTTTTEVTESTTTSTPTETNSTTPAEPTNTTTLAELSTITTAEPSTAEPSTAEPSTAEPTTTTTADPSTAEPTTTTTADPSTADPSTAEPTTTTTTSLAESFKNLKGATEPTAPTPAEPTATTPAEPTATTPAESTTTGETTTTTAIPETTTAQVCGLEQKCVCFKPVADVETDGFDFEWHNFLYGGLAGVGAIVLLVVLYQLICFKEKKSKGAYEIGMSDYVSDDVA